MENVLLYKPCALAMLCLDPCLPLAQVYCAPTSGGKSLVAEVLMIRQLCRSMVLEGGRRRRPVSAPMYLAWLLPGPPFFWQQLALLHLHARSRSRVLKLLLIYRIQSLEAGQLALGITAQHCCHWLQQSLAANMQSNTRELKKMQACLPRVTTCFQVKILSLP